MSVKNLNGGRFNINCTSRASFGNCSRPGSRELTFLLGSQPWEMRESSHSCLFSHRYNLPLCSRYRFSRLRLFSGPSFLHAFHHFLNSVVKRKWKYLLGLPVLKIENPKFISGKKWSSSPPVFRFLCSTLSVVQWVLPFKGLIFLQHLWGQDEFQWEVAGALSGSTLQCGVEHKARGVIIHGR